MSPLNTLYSFHGHKLEHALKYGPTNGLFLVSIGWFVDSVRRKVRLSESLYSISVGKVDDLNRIVQNSSIENSCLPIGSPEYAKQPDTTEGQQLRFSERVTKRTVASAVAGYSFYVDTEISAELHNKVVEAVSTQGATLVDQWFVGCTANYVVCEGSSIQKYLGHSSNIVTPLWVLKTAKHPQKLVHLSADLARNIGTILDTVQNSISCEEVNGVTGPQGAPGSVIKISHEERQNIANLAKDGVRKRRGNRMQTCQIPIRPITPSSLLDSICWSISDPASTASIYTDSSSVENADEDHAVFFDAKGDGKESEASFVNLSRPLTESEKSELIFKSPFLTVLFPIDRFSEMGPRSRTFFSDKGFTCLQVLDHIYTFYQENMSTEEIFVAIHTDSRHADRLRAVYSSKQNTVEFKRIDFLGSRRSFEMLKRVSGDNNSNVYELLIRA
ncbi:BRCT domain-containing DNA repair protein [Abeliophyllum distichum]|uniref:BRCT domain-containing DNA repair protein n=1 Tax=Abeliophyllum distichum TaxID=126358 RepID=A0ABD1UK69_9LAMI